MPSATSWNHPGLTPLGLLELGDNREVAFSLGDAAARTDLRAQGWPLGIAHLFVDLAPASGFLQQWLA